MDVKLNKILIEYFEIGYLIDYNTKQPITGNSFRGDKAFKGIKTTVQPDPKTLKYFSSLLIRNCAEKIYLVDYGFPLSSAIEVHDNLPESLKNKIEIVDKNHYHSKRISKFLEPIYSDLEDPLDIRCVNEIGKFIHKISIGSRYKAEVEIFHFSTLSALFKEVRKKILDDEAMFRLDAISGIYNLYSHSEIINTVSLYPMHFDLSIEKRITTLLKEADIIDASYQRHLLGIPHHYKKAKFELERLIDKIVQNPRTRDFVNPVKDIIVMTGGIPPQVIPDIPNISKYQNHTYNPPIVSLEGFKKDITQYIAPKGLEYYYSWQYYGGLLPKEVMGKDKPDT